MDNINNDLPLGLTLKPHEMAALLRQDLSSFICRAFQELSPQTEYLHNWHIDLIASKLKDVADGKITRLIINIPPRNLKSICASVAFPAWLLGHYPHHKIICASYASDLAIKLATDCRQVMQAPWYQEVFPNTKLAASRVSASDFNTTKNGGRMAVSTGGGITGRGADILIIDDPLKPDDAPSDVIRNNVNTWFDGTAYTRLNSKKDGAIIIIMQRLHLDDLVGYAIEKGGWEVINLPAIAEEYTEHTYETIYGTRTVIRHPGSPLHGARESLETLAMIKANMSEYQFYSQYQQSPVPMGGGMIKNEWLQRYESHELPESFEMIVQSWDTASKVNNFSDFSVGITLGIKNKKIYVIDIKRARMDFPTLRRAALAAYHQYKPNTILIEDASSGTQLVQDLKEQDIYCVKPVRPEGDKKSRLFAQASIFDSGKVYLPTDAHWVDDFIHELTAFPSAKFDDQVDAMSQALTYIREYLDEPSFLTYMRQQAEKSGLSKSNY
jgi:predicted phage terminase large subunit-like protein